MARSRPRPPASEGGHAWRTTRAAAFRRRCPVRRQRSFEMDRRPARHRGFHGQRESGAMESREWILRGASSQRRYRDKRKVRQTFNCTWNGMEPADVGGSSQNRGNSGVFLMGLFEIQVLDSFQSRTYADGQAGALYGQWPPLVNSVRRPGEWQAYDIAFEAPQFSGRQADTSRVDDGVPERSLASQP